MMKTFAEGIRDNEHLIREQIAKSFDFGDMMGTVDSNSTNNSRIIKGGVTINVYGAEGQDIHALAELIGEELNKAVTDEGMVYA